MVRDRRKPFEISELLICVRQPIGLARSSSMKRARTVLTTRRWYMHTAWDLFRNCKRPIRVKPHKVLSVELCESCGSGSRMPHRRSGAGLFQLQRRMRQFYPTTAGCKQPPVEQVIGASILHISWMHSFTVRGLLPRTPHHGASAQRRAATHNTSLKRNFIRKRISFRLGHLAVLFADKGDDQIELK